MASQLSLLDYTSEAHRSALITQRHLNHSVSNRIGFQDVDAVSGLKFVAEFLTPKQQDYCVQQVDAAVDQWRNDLSRRVQHYGWRYDYKARAITPDMHIGALPDWLGDLAQRLYDETGLFDRVPEQVIVNEYLPGQGIATHIDHPRLWADGMHHIAARRLGDGFFRKLARQVSGAATARFLRLADRRRAFRLAARYCAAQVRGDGHWTPTAKTQAILDVPNRCQSGRHERRQIERSDHMANDGKVYIIGAGPGDPELLTLKAKRIIDDADVIIYADSLVPEEIAGYAKPGAAVYGSKDMALPEIMQVTLQAISEGKTVARIQSGDPSLYGATLEQMRILEAEGIDYEIIPGVSAAFAAAAVLKSELTVPEVSQTVIMTRAEGRVPMPEGEDLIGLARHGSTLVIFLSVTRMFRIANQLQEAGYPADTPVAIAYRVGWPDQQIIRGTLTDIRPEGARCQDHPPGADHRRQGS